MLNTFVNKSSSEMHLLGHKFTGPGTNLCKRLISNATPKEWSTPINRIDNAAYHHDLCYSKHDDTKPRNQVNDKTMLNELNGKVNTTSSERIDKSIVVKFINAKVNVRLGAPTKATRILKFTDELAEELYKPVIGKFQIRRVNVSGIDEICAGDLTDMQGFLNVSSFPEVRPL